VSTPNAGVLKMTMAGRNTNRQGVRNMQATIEKTEVIDYESFATGRVNTGRAFKVTLDIGLEMYLPQSWTKKRVIEYVQSQVGAITPTWSA
jgi:hypothetical protein